MTSWESWEPWDAMYRVWETTLGKSQIVLTYPSLKGLWQWFAREVAMRNIDAAEIDVQSFVDPKLTVGENKEILKAILFSPITEVESADMYKEVKALLEDQVRRKYPQIVGALDDKIVRLERTEKTSKERYKKIKALELQLLESERLLDEEKARPPEMAPVKVKILKPFSEGIFDYTPGSVIESKDLDWVLQKIKDGSVERVDVTVAVETKGPPKELSAKELRWLQDDFKAYLMGSLGRIPTNVMSEYRVAMRKIMFLSYDEALKIVTEKAKEIIARESLRKRRIGVPAVAPPPKKIFRLPEEDDAEGMIRMPVARPAYVPAESFGELPWARRPSSGERDKLWNAFIYKLAQKGYNPYEHEKLFNKYISNVTFRDWPTVQKKFDEFVSHVLAGTEDELPPIFIWEGNGGIPPALAGTVGSVWRMNAEEQRMDAIIHFTSNVIRNARSGYVPKKPEIEELLEMLEQYRVMQVTHAEIVKAINYGVENKLPWFAGISREELNEFLET